MKGKRENEKLGGKGLNFAIKPSGCYRPTIPFIHLLTWIEEFKELNLTQQEYKEVSSKYQLKYIKEVKFFKCNKIENKIQKMKMMKINDQVEGS